MFFSVNIKLQKIETVLLQTSVGVFLQEFLRFILNVTLSDILKLEGDQMMWAFQKKKKINFWYYFSGVFYDGEMYKGLISIIDFLKG